MPLYSRCVHVNCPQQGVQGHVAYILVVIEQEPSQDVDRQHSETALGLDVHDGQDGLVQDGVADVLTGLGVGRDLCEDVVHRFGRLGVVFAQYPEEAEDFDLEIMTFIEKRLFFML